MCPLTVKSAAPSASIPNLSPNSLHTLSLILITFLWIILLSGFNFFVFVFVSFFTDLIPREIVEKWLKHLRNEFPTVAFKASTQTQKQNLVRIYSEAHSSDIVQPTDKLLAVNLPTNYQQLTSNLPITCQPLTNNLPTTYQQLTNNLLTTYQQLTNNLLTTYQQPTNNLPTTYKQLIDYLPTTYQQLTNNFPTTYQQPTNNLPTTYQQLTNNLPTTYKQLIDYLPTTYQQHLVAIF